MNQSMEPLGLGTLPPSEGDECSAIRDGDVAVKPTSRTLDVISKGNARRGDNSSEAMAAERAAIPATSHRQHSNERP